MSVVSFSAVGRRKKAIARVRLIPGEGNITINKRSLDEYFGLETLKTVVRQPLTLTETLGRFDVVRLDRLRDFRGIEAHRTRPDAAAAVDARLRLVLADAVAREQEKPRGRLRRADLVGRD